MYGKLKQLFEAFKKADQSVITTCIALVLFAIGSALGTVMQIVTSLLTFVVVLEVTRIAVEYVISPTHRIKLRYVIDTVIVFILREILIMVSGKDAILTEVDHLKIMCGLLIFMMVYRWISMVLSPDDLEPEYKDKK